MSTEGTDSQGFTPLIVAMEYNHMPIVVRHYLLLASVAGGCSSFSMHLREVQEQNVQLRYPALPPHRPACCWVCAPVLSLQELLVSAKANVNCANLGGQTALYPVRQAALCHGATAGWYACHNHLLKHSTAVTCGTASTHSNFLSSPVLHTAGREASQPQGCEAAPAPRGERESCRPVAANSVDVSCGCGLRLAARLHQGVAFCCHVAFGMDGRQLLGVSQWTSCPTAPPALLRISPAACSCAARVGATDVAAELINAGAAIDGSDDRDYTPLLCAAMERHLPMLKLLLSECQ